MKARDARIGVIVGGVLVAIAAGLPWATLGIISASGLQGDGVIAILIGVAIVAIVLASFSEGPSSFQRSLIVLLSFAGLGLYVLEYLNVERLVTSSRGGIFAPGIGGGILVGGAGGLIATVFSFSIGGKQEDPGTSPPSVEVPSEQSASSWAGAGRRAVVIVAVVGLLLVAISVIRSGGIAGAAIVPRTPQTVSGSGTSKTAPIDLQGDYEVSWTITPTDSSGCFHGAYLRRTDGAFLFEALGSEMLSDAAVKSGSTRLYGLESTHYYVDVNSGCGWTITFTPT
jgi:hypothetical protein